MGHPASETETGSRFPLPAAPRPQQTQDQHQLPHVIRVVIGDQQRLGARNDVHLDQLVALARDMNRFFGRELPGMVYKIGMGAACAAPA